MVNIGSSTESLPPGVELIPGPRVQRTVLLRPCPSPTSPAYTQAAAAQHTTSPPHTQAVAVQTPLPSANSQLQASGPIGLKTAHAPTAVQGLDFVQHALQTQQQTQHAQQEHQHPQQQQPLHSQQVQTEAQTQEQPQAPLVYACSWWDASEVDRYLADRSQPIW